MKPVRIVAMACALSALITLAPLAARAQTAPGTAGLPGEAPGAGHLAPMPPEDLGHVRGEDPAAARSMAFGAARGECRETVPGGTLLAVAYAVVLALLGGYMALLARKNAQLTAALDDLEREIESKRASPDADGKA